MSKSSMVLYIVLACLFAGLLVWSIIHDKTFMAAFDAFWLSTNIHWAIKEGVEE